MQKNIANVVGGRRPRGAAIRRICSKRKYRFKIDMSQVK